MVSTFVVAALSVVQRILLFPSVGNYDHTVLRYGGATFSGKLMWASYSCGVSPGLFFVSYGSFKKTWSMPLVLATHILGGPSSSLRAGPIRVS